MDRILRLPDVKAATGLSRSTIYQRMERKTFPAPMALGARAIGWRESDITAWLEALRNKGAEALAPAAPATRKGKSRTAALA
jgi:prophage regulatory protein